MNTQDGEKLIFWWAVWNHRTPCELHYLNWNTGPDLRLKNSSYSWLEPPVTESCFYPLSWRILFLCFRFFAVFFSSDYRDLKEHVNISFLADCMQMFPKETTFYGQLYLQDFIYLLVFPGRHLNICFRKKQFLKKNQEPILLFSWP